ncbi:MAG: hypothetical protein RLZZ524_1786, partial [Pseudomonadota bacterium]
LAPDGAQGLAKGPGRGIGPAALDVAQTLNKKFSTSPSLTM